MCLYELLSLKFSFKLSRFYSTHSTSTNATQQHYVSVKALYFDDPDTVIHVRVNHKILLLDMYVFFETLCSVADIHNLNILGCCRHGYLL